MPDSHDEPIRQTSKPESCRSCGAAADHKHSGNAQCIVAFLCGAVEHWHSVNPRFYCGHSLKERPCPTGAADRRNQQKTVAFKAALARAKAEDQQAQKLICGLFPVGTRVQWMHGDNIRSGTVKEFSGNNADRLRVGIESRSGKTCWIYAGRLLSFAGLTQ